MSSTGRSTRAPTSSMNNGEDEEFDTRDLDPDMVTSNNEHLNNKKSVRRSWAVDIIDQQGNKKKRCLKVSDVWVLPDGERVFISFDGGVPDGTDADGLLGGFLGVVARDYESFPIRYDSWPKVPKDGYKKRYFKDTIKLKWYWEEKFEDAAYTYIMMDIGKKWRDSRNRLFHKYYDMAKSLAENMSNPPLRIPKEDWSEYLEYRFSQRTMKIAEKNTDNRGENTSNHRGGTMNLRRKKRELMALTNEEVTRGLLYVETRKRRDGSYANEKVRSDCEKICEIESQGTCSKNPSPNDSLGQVLGKEHHGRVRGMGGGLCPTKVFDSGYKSFCGSTSSTASSSDSQWKSKVEQLQLKSASDSELMKDMASTIALLCKKIDIPLPSKVASILENSLEENATTNPSFESENHLHDT